MTEDLTVEHKLLCDVAAVRAHLEKYSNIEQRKLLERVVDHLRTIVEAQSIPAQSSLELSTRARNATIEECARVADRWGDGEATIAAAEIRMLKASAFPSTEGK